MTQHHPLPLPEQILLLLLAPPILSCIFRVSSRGFGQIVQGGSVSKRTKLRQSSEFWILLIVLYIAMFAMLLYGRFLNR